MNWRRLTPRSTVRARLLASAVIWTAVGAALLVVGWQRVFAGGVGWVASLPLAVAAGWFKGRHWLAPRAADNARRIRESGDGRCLGGVFSGAGWALVVVMMASGAGLRRSAVPPQWTGWICFAVGIGLIRGSASAWRAFSLSE